MRPEEAHPAYPVRVTGSLEPGLSRGLWLVKWLLVIPHAIVLAFLWIAFAVLSVFAFFAILLTGRYPRAVFDFNLGVMRWTWRVAFYAYSALGTDRYPPFTLADVEDYPARLEIDPPERLSRGLVLIKTWLLAIPHYLVLSFFAGSGLWLVIDGDESNVLSWGAGLIGLLVLIAAVSLLFTGRYPLPLFDLILGLNRWSWRVAGYAALMTDRYPPFRLDLGPGEPAPDSARAGAASTAPDQAAADAPARPRWGAGRVVALVAGCVAIAAALPIAAAGAGLAYLDHQRRDGDGYLISRTHLVETATRAVVTDNLQLHADGAARDLPGRVLGRIKITAAAPDGGGIFLGIAATEDVESYLADVDHAVLRDFGGGRDPVAHLREIPGGAVPSPPGDQAFWVASAGGPGEQTLTWKLRNGDWTVVLMRADGARDVSAEVRAGATVPALEWGAAALFAIAGATALLGLVLVAVALRWSGPASTPEPSTP